MQKILIVAATGFEIAPLLTFLENYKTSQPFHYQLNSKEIKILITGAGIAFTSYALGKFYATNTVDLAINIGIAGAFNRNLALGEVVNVQSDCFGDFGVELADGSFSSIFQLDWMNPNQFPFVNRMLINSLSQPTLKAVKGMTINKVHGNENSISKLDLSKIDIESMEGAAFFYATQIEKIPCFQFRSISNYVENRDKSNWNIPLAINQLNEYIINWLSSN